MNCSLYAQTNFGPLPAQQTPMGIMIGTPQGPALVTPMGVGLLTPMGLLGPLPIVVLGVFPVQNGFSSYQELAMASQQTSAMLPQFGKPKSSMNNGIKLAGNLLDFSQSLMSFFQ